MTVMNFILSHWLGFQGGQGGDARGGGGYGGESYLLLDTGLNGKGGDMGGESRDTAGLQGGGAGESGQYFQKCETCKGYFFPKGNQN